MRRADRQGGTLGDDHKRWFRTQFFQQHHAYLVFRKLLESGHPPDDWQQLLPEAQKQSQRIQ